MLSTYTSSDRTIDLIQSLLLFSFLSEQKAGVTALTSAAQGGHVDTVKLLLDRRASVETKDNVSTRRCITTHMHVYIK